MVVVICYFPFLLFWLLPFNSSAKFTIWVKFLTPKSVLLSLITVESESQWLNERGGKFSYSCWKNKKIDEENIKNFHHESSM